MKISREWYKGVFEEYVITQYGSLSKLEEYNPTVFDEIRDYMHKQVMQNYNPLDTTEIKEFMKENKKLCSEYINEHRGM